MTQETKFKQVVLESLKHLLKNQERPSFMEKSRMNEIYHEINNQLKELEHPEIVGQIPSGEIPHDNISSGSKLSADRKNFRRPKTRITKTGSIRNSNEPF